MNRDRLGSLLRQEEIAAIRLDPLLMIAVLEDLAEAAERPKRKRPDLTMQVLDSYCDFYDLDPLAGQEPQALLEMAALTCRVSALTDLGARIPPKPGPERLERIAEAACSARLTETDGHPAFQLLDFIAALDRAEKGLAP